VYFGSGVDFSVQQLSSSFALARIVRWPAVQEPLSTEEVERVRESVTGVLATRLTPERAREIMAPYFESHMLPTHRPALQRAFVDDAERVWLEQFVPVIMGTPLQLTSSRWTVLAADGRPLAALELPPLTRLEHVRGERAVVVHRDSSTDVESVAVYRIEGERR
jgi:hypothetical protein